MTGSTGVEENSRHSRGLFWFAIILSCLTVVLIVAGALVTTRDAGDSVPDWPLSFGRWLIHSDYFVANVRYEYSHRVIAGLVAITTFVMALWAWRTENRGWMKRLAWVAFAGVVAQALIGGGRVLFPSYKPLIAVPHALIAQSFFATIVGIAAFSSRSWWSAGRFRIDDGRPRLRSLMPVAIAAVLCQLVLGAGFRHGAFGIIPHILGAVVVTSLIIWVSITILKRHGEERFLARPAVTLMALLAIQVVLGILAYLARLASVNDPQPLEPLISLTVAHVVVGALLLATTVVLTIRCYRALAIGVERGEGIAGARPLASSHRRATV